MKCFVFLLSLVAASLAAPYIGSNYLVQDDIVTLQIPSGQKFVVDGPYGQVLSQYQPVLTQNQFQNLLNQVYQNFGKTGLNNFFYNILQSFNKQLVQGILTPQQYQQLSQIENLIQEQGLRNQVSYGTTTETTGLGNFLPTGQYNYGGYGQTRIGVGNNYPYKYQTGLGFGNKYLYKYYPYYAKNGYTPLVGQSHTYPSQSLLEKYLFGSYYPYYSSSIQGGYTGPSYVIPYQVYGDYGAGVYGQLPYGSQHYGVPAVAY